jgi:hypothetical protein
MEAKTGSTRSNKKSDHTPLMGTIKEHLQAVEAQPTMVFIQRRPLTISEVFRARNLVLT